MSEEKGESGTKGLGAEAEEAERRLQEAATSASAAEQRATAEIRILEADLEKQRLRHDEELRGERGAKERAIAAAESRLSEIEAHAEAAEKRVKAAERRAADAEGAIADAETRAREAAAAWLRGQIKAIRREAGWR
ncbi:MAG: hypothetical protein FVQ78_04665 [Solirubrobacterales bacterium]|nr:hypothetical protein [Solirubrobacterales bacterium]